MTSSAPYVLPGDLLSAPLGVSWSSIGDGTGVKPAPPANLAALLQGCHIATGDVITECDQALGGEVVTETVDGPGHRFGIRPGGFARILTSFQPILKILGVECTTAQPTPNRTWTAVPAGYFEAEQVPWGLYTGAAPNVAHPGQQAIHVSTSWANWAFGRYGYRVSFTYLHGFPHAQLAADAATGDSVLSVDDLTGWAGATGWVLDGPNTELVTVTAVAAQTPTAWSPTVNYQPGAVVLNNGVSYMALLATGPGTTYGAIQPTGAVVPTPVGASPFWLPGAEPTGPGTATLAAPLRYEHSAPVLVTTMPPTLRWSAALFAKAWALERGIATLSVPSGSGSSHAIGPSEAADAARREAVVAAGPFRRII